MAGLRDLLSRASVLARHAIWSPNVGAEVNLAMSQLIDGVHANRRPLPARIGIVMLNLLTPGLGLIRLGQSRRGFTFILTQFAVLSLLILLYAFGPTLDFPRFLGVVGIVLATLLALYLGSMTLSWSASRSKAERSGHLWRWYGVLFIWFAASLVSIPAAKLARSYYHPFYSPSEAMMPTLEVEDRFLAHMTSFEPIGRGDVVVVRNGAVDYVKRIAGIPGDRISLHRGVVVLNGVPIKQSKLDMASANSSPDGAGAIVLEERFPGEPSAHQVLDIGVTPQDDWPEVRLGTGQFVVLGDNRDNSLDSRFPSEMGGFGIVPSDRIKGRVLFRYWRKSTGFGEGRL